MNIINLPVVLPSFQTPPYGTYHPSQVTFEIKFKLSNTVTLILLNFYYDNIVYGIEALYSDNSKSPVYGSNSGYLKNVSLTDKKIKIVRIISGSWIDSIEFCFDNNECTGKLGGNGGGMKLELNLNNLKPFGGYEIDSFIGASIGLINNLAVTYKSWLNNSDRIES